MLHQVDDASTARHVRHRAVPRTNRTPATSSRAYQSKSARVDRAGIVMQSSEFGLAAERIGRGSNSIRSHLVRISSSRGSLIELKTYGQND
jgi:hypothetical protein